MSRLPTPLEMIRHLVACPSVSSHEPALDQSNRGVVDLLAGWGEVLGARVHLLDVPDHPGKTNVALSFGPETGEPAALLLSGHTDTVPCEPDLWTSAPWTPTVRDERLYGLGTADMKGFLALALCAAERVGALKRPLTILGTADEESGMYGARALVADGRRLAEHAVIGEPTGGRPIRMHKGILMGEVTLKGKSGHSSFPEGGRNAIDGLHATLGALMRIRSGWRQHAPEFEVPEPTMNFGQVSGGDAPNRICGRCRLTFDVRLLPGMDGHEVIGEVDRAIQSAVTPLGLTAQVGPAFDPIPAFENPADSRMVQLAETWSGQEAGAVMFGTEAPFFQQLGMDTVVMGPGSIDVAHQPDEFLALSEIEPTIKRLGRLIHALCAE